MITQLLFNLTPFVGESIHGYALRLANANSYKNSKWLREIPGAGDYIKQIVGQSIYGSVPTWIQNEFGVQPHTTYPRTPFSLVFHARFCPECLREEAYWKWQWEYAFLISCPTHGVLLIGQCCHCKKRVTWNRPKLLECTCGALYSKMQPTLADADTIKMCQLLEKKLANDIGFGYGSRYVSAFPQLESISLINLSRFIQNLGACANISEVNPTSLSFAPSNIEHARILVTSAAKLLIDWPANFHIFLHASGKLNEGDMVMHELPHQFTRVAHAVTIASWSKSVEFEFFRTAYRDFMKSHWLGILDKRHNWATSEDREKQRYIPRNLAARSLGVSPLSIKGLIADGILEGDIKRSNKERCYVLVDRHSIATAKEFLANQLTKKDAAILLGISDYRITELANHGFIQVFHRLNRSTPVSFYSKREVLHFMARLSNHRRPALKNEIQVSGDYLLKHYSFPDGEFIKLVKAIFVGELFTLGCTDDGPKITSLIFSANDFKNWQTEIRKSDGELITIDEAAKHLGIKQQVAYDLVRKNILTSRRVEHKHRHCQMISWEDIHAFSDMYISAAQLATTNKTSPKKMVWILKKKGIQAVTGAEIDGCRQYFYLIKTIENM